MPREIYFNIVIYLYSCSLNWELKFEYTVQFYETFRFIQIYKIALRPAPDTSFNNKA